jgi:hypothetical protein
MVPGFAFETKAPDGTPYRVIYTKHFVNRYEFDEPPHHKAAKRTLSEDEIGVAIRRAVPGIDEAVYGTVKDGTIAHRAGKFAMIFAVIDTDAGHQLNMVTISGRVDFTPRSAKEVVILVKPEFAVRFPVPLSYALKLSVLADISENWEILEDGKVYHLRGDLMEYWIERQGEKLYIPQADWTREMMEVEI